MVISHLHQQEVLRLSLGRPQESPTDQSSFRCDIRSSAGTGCPAQPAQTDTLLKHRSFCSRGPFCSSRQTCVALQIYSVPPGTHKVTTATIKTNESNHSVSCTTAAGPSAAITSGQIWEIILFPCTVPGIDAPLRSRRCVKTLLKIVCEQRRVKGAGEPRRGQSLLILTHQ